MRLLLVSAVLVAIAATALLPGSAHSAYPGRNGLIAFISERKGMGAGVYTMHTDGTGLRQLTGSAPYAQSPTFSPDGRTVAFQRDSDDDTSDVWLAAANGTQLRPLLHGVGEPLTRSPSWSPDGRWIAFVGAHDVDATEHLYLVRPDGTGLRKLADGSDPAWSPDGKRVVFDRGGWIWTIGARRRAVRGACTAASRRPGRRTGGASRTSGASRQTTRRRCTSWTRTARTSISSRRTSACPTVSRRTPGRLPGRRPGS